MAQSLGWALNANLLGRREHILVKRTERFRHCTLSSDPGTGWRIDRGSQSLTRQKL